MSTPFVSNFFGDEIDRICEIESLTGRNLGEVEHLVLFPATHFMTNEEHMEEAIKNIMEEMEAQVKQFEAEGNSSRLNVSVKDRIRCRNAP